jgi:hypothetical protein
MPELVSSKSYGPLIIFISCLAAFAAPSAALAAGSGTWKDLAVVLTSTDLSAKIRTAN